MTEKNPKYTIAQDVVFTGKNYIEWQTRIKAALAKEGLLSLLMNVATQKKFTKLDSDERPEKMKDYFDKQGQAIILIYNCLQWEFVNARQFTKL